MRLSTRVTYAVVAAIALPLVACLLFALGVYAWGARHVPERLPTPGWHAPAAVRAQYLAVEAPGARGMRRVGLLSVWFVLLSDLRRDPVSPEERWLWRATHAAGHTWNRPSGAFARHASMIASAVRVSRDWNDTQSVDAILSLTRYRDGVLGFEAASRHYFGVPGDALRPQETLVLIALAKSPSLYDPICSPQRFARRHAEIVRTLGKSGPAWSTQAALTRMRTHECPTLAAPTRDR